MPVGIISRIRAHRNDWPSKEPDHAGIEVVHRSDDFDFAVGFHVAEDSAAGTDGFHGLKDAFLGDSRHEVVVLRFLFAVEILASGVCGAKFVDQRGDVTQLDVVNGGFDGAAGGMAQDHDEFGAGNAAAELHAAEEVFVDHTAGDTTDEKITDSFVEYIFYGNAAIEAGEDDGFWVLTGCGFPYHGGVVAGGEVVGDEAGIACHQLSQYGVRRKRLLLLGGEDLITERRRGEYDFCRVRCGWLRVVGGGSRLTTPEQGYGGGGEENSAGELFHVDRGRYRFAA